jgi:hypothetical protein
MSCVPKLFLHSFKMESKRKSNIYYTTVQQLSYQYTFMYGPMDRSVGIATGYGLDDRGVGVRVPGGSRIFSSPRRPDWLWAGVLSRGVKRQGREADH